MCQSELTEFFAELTEFFAELTEFAPKLSEFSSPKQYSGNSIPPVSEVKMARSMWASRVEIDIAAECCPLCVCVLSMRSHDIQHACV